MQQTVDAQDRSISSLLILLLLYHTCCHFGVLLLYSVYVTVYSVCTFLVEFHKFVILWYVLLRSFFFFFLKYKFLYGVCYQIYITLWNWGEFRVVEFWPRSYITFFMLNSAEHEIFLLINMKIPTIVGIFICISRENFMLGYVLARKNLQLLVIWEFQQDRFHAQRSWAWKKVLKPRGQFWSFLAGLVSIPYMLCKSFAILTYVLYLLKSLGQRSEQRVYTAKCIIWSGSTLIANRPAILDIRR